jgi:tRNA modification GTPase
MRLTLEDTIVAIATPPGRGAVGLVRLSGPDAWAIGRRIFHRRRDRHPPRSHHLYLGNAIDPATGAVLDEGLIAFMRGPHSYTGDDAVEINAHGAPIVLAQIVAAALAAGARAAEPGEMTLRAFLHGRIDLAQAEAVADLIAADTQAAARQSLDALGGALSAPVQQARGEILHALVPIDASIDFPEEEVPPPQLAAIADAVASAAATIADLLSEAERGRITREGARCVICGRPNVGKSSLLNALLRADRAIVAPLAGTTRDTIEEIAVLGGIACHLTDTAGLAETADPIERLGIERSRAALARADLIIWVVDRSQPLMPADREALSTIAGTASTDRWLIALNKSDLPCDLDLDVMRDAICEASLSMPPAERIVATSLVTGAGLDELEKALVASLLGASGDNASGRVARTRHRDALRAAAESLASAQTALRDEMPLDFVAEDLRQALDALGTITGETITEDLLEQIFQEFCIGK